MTYNKFCETIATALKGFSHTNSKGEINGVYDISGHQICWVQGSDEPGTKLADISDIIKDGFSCTRCYLGDDNDGSFYVWDNLDPDIDELRREGQILIYHGKSIKTALKRHWRIILGTIHTSFRCGIRMNGLSL